MNLHRRTIVRNMLKAPFNRSKLRSSLKQKRLSLCHNEKNTIQPQKCYPEDPRTKAKRIVQTIKIDSKTPLQSFPTANTPRRR
jgi:hypothetical protein